MELVEEAARLCGRDVELEAVASLTTPGRARPAAAIVAGSAGIGKTRLLAEAADRATQNGLLVLWGSCLDVGEAWPLHPIREAALRMPKRLVTAAADRLVDAIERNRAGEESRDALAAVHAELVDLAERHPVLLVLDDLQWADSSTIRLLFTLLSGLTSAPVSIVGSMRTDAEAGTNPVGLLAELHRSPESSVIELGPLDEEATLELARSVSTAPISRQESDRLQRRSGGIPFLVIELARHGQREDDTPTGVRVRLEARLAQLPDEALGLVRLASMGIGPLPHDIATAVLERDDDGVISSAREAVTAGVLVADSNGYAPVHDLYREVSIAGLLGPERRLLHRRIAEALEAKVGDVEPDPIELAHHWVGAGDGTRALPSFVEAARNATKIGAAVEAWEHWRVAADILTDPADDIDDVALLMEAAAAAHDAEQYAEALQLIDWAERSVDEHLTERKVALQLARARYLAASGELDVANRACSVIVADRRAPAEMVADAGALSADLLTRLGRYEEAVMQAEAMLERSDHAADCESAQLLALAALGYSSACLGDYEAGRANLDDALDRAERSGRPELIEAASRHYADLLMGPLNELEAGITFAEERANDLLERGADARFTTSLLAIATTGLFRLGRWRDARRSASNALESDPTGAATVDLLLGRARVVLGLGDFATAERDLDAVSSLIGAEPNPRQFLPLATLRSGLAMWRQDVVTSRQEVDWALGRIDVARFKDHLLLAALVWHGLRTEAMANDNGQAVEEERATRLLAIMERLREDAPDIDSDQAQLIEAYHLLCRGEFDRFGGQPDPEVWADAAVVWDRCGHPYPAAYCRLQEATILFGERTRNSRARQVLRTAYQLADRLAARPLVADIEALAHRARIDLTDLAEPSAVDETSDDTESVLSTLTSRERDVIAEVAKGLSNREIGERLYISGRTVGVHVSRILAKLEVRTRVEAAALYSREQADET